MVLGRFDSQFRAQGPYLQMRFPWLEILDTHAHLDTASKSNNTLHLTSIFRDFYMSTDLKSSVIHECNKQCRFFTANFLAISEF